jgi:hypothetical protein
MLTLEALGTRDAVATFPAELDLGAVEEIQISRLLVLLLWEDVLDAVRAAARADLEPAVEAVVDDGKRRLALPADYRRRNLPGPPPMRASAAPPCLATCRSRFSTLRRARRSGPCWTRARGS